MRGVRDRDFFIFHLVKLYTWKFGIPFAPV